MGILKKLTTEYFGETERKEDMVEVPEGVIRVDFTDMNGVRHKRGYRVEDGNRGTLEKLIKKLVNKRGVECNLNDVDVSNVTDMGGMFKYFTFNGDISGWDVSNVDNMYRMFYSSSFTGENGDISKWNVSKVKNMAGMFYNSDFNGDVSEWKWKVWNVKNMCSMFRSSAFTGENGDISGWKVNPECIMVSMFYDSPLENNPPEWYHQ